MPELRLTRRVDIQTNSVALSPSGEFFTYVDHGHIAVDDGRRRLFRKSARRIGKINGGYVVGATDTGVIFKDTDRLGFVSLDGTNKDLVPSRRLVPTSLHIGTSTLTVVVGARVVQFDTETWTQRRNIDVAEDLDIPSYSWCTYDGDRVALGTMGRLVVLDRDGNVDVVHPAARRERPFVVGERLYGTRVDGTVVHDVITDEEVDFWPGEMHACWCSSAREVRSAKGGEVIVRPAGADPIRYTTAQPPAERFTYFAFADRAQRAVSWQLHGKHFDLFEW